MDLRDELISFETAKLAKEKGFDVECERYFDETGGMWTYNNWGDGLRDGAYWRPTQSLLQKWLREKYNIEVISQRADDYIWYKYRIDSRKFAIYKANEIYNSKQK